VALLTAVAAVCGCRSVPDGLFAAGAGTDVRDAAVTFTAQEGSEMAGITVCCGQDNDLYRTLKACGFEVQRFDKPGDAVDAAPPGGGALVLADEYPQQTTEIPGAALAQAAAKNLRLYVEFPLPLPGLKLDPPRHTELERTVVVSEVFGETLRPLDLLAIHDCHFVGVNVDKAHLVLAKVAGLDRAVFGLDDVRTHPFLFEHPDREILVCTGKLSQFVTARYVPKKAIQAVWKWVLGWTMRTADMPDMDWTSTVRPTHGRSDTLPADAERRAVIRGVDWHTRARMLPHDSWIDRYDRYRREGKIDPHNPVGPQPDPSWPSGEGENGVLEGVASRIRYDGRQSVRWWLRSDSNGESALAFALRSRMDGDERSGRIAGNLLDWVYSGAGLFQNDPDNADYGLVHWASNSGALYGDNDIKIILSCIGTVAMLGTDRWDESLVKNIMGNFRTTGRNGFRTGSLAAETLRERGWRHYWESDTVNYAPHYEAWLWSSFFWFYDKTRDPILLERTRRAVEMMMEAYPDNWRWTNGIQQERGRMLLTLAWLIRVDDKPQYRTWLARIAGDMRKRQDASGAIHEELGDPGKGNYPPARSNAEYGKHEASIIQQNGDPISDLLYTCNFAFLGLHAAYAATGDEQYRAMEDRMAEFLVRIQVRSEAHPEFDGGWFRAFDTGKWDYWGSNADAGWGAWAIETGWTQAWIPTVLAMRQLGLNLWDISSRSRVVKHWETVREQMLGR